MNGMRSAIKICSLSLIAASLCLGGCGGKEEKKESQPKRANRPPVVTKVEIMPMAPRAGDTLKAMVQAMDPDGDPLEISYIWEVNGRELEGENDEELRPEVLRPGDRVVVWVTVGDGKLWAEPMASQPKVIGPERVGRVHLDLVPQVAFPGQKLAVVVKTDESNREPPPLRFRWKVNGEVAKEGEDAEFSTDGLKRGDVIQVEGFMEEASEGLLIASSREVVLQNSPPTILSLPPESLIAPGRYLYRVKAVDPDGDSLTFRLEGEVPEGMTIDPSTGVIRWNFTKPPEEPLKVDIRVSDGHGGEAQQTYEIVFPKAGT